MQAPFLFLPAFDIAKSKPQLAPKFINKVWNEVAEFAGVKGRTPHSARHGMGKHLIEKTGKISAVQRQLGHKNVAYSIQYTRTTGEELEEALNDR